MPAAYLLYGGAMEKKQFIHLIKTALQAAKELGANVDPDKFKSFVNEVNQKASTCRPFDYEVVQQINALNTYAKKLGITPSSKPVRSNGHAQFF